MPKKIERVLVVGAGMAGLTLAISLRRQGLNPDIVERQSQWPVHGAGIYLLGNAMRALGHLHLADEVLQNGSPIPKQTMLDAQGRQLAVVDTASVWAKCGPCVGIRRACLQNILVTALGDAKIRFGTTVTGLSQQQDFATVAFSDGSKQEYDLVVGADGVRSSIRSHLFGNVLPRFCGQIGWRFLVRCPPTITGWTVMTGERGVFLILPVGAGQAYCYADAAVDKPFDDPVEGRLERLRARLASFADPVPQVVAELQSSEQIHFGSIEDIFQKPWGAGSALLIGDAAHAASPNMASGAAMAFEDALVLSRLILSGRAAAQVLSDYTAKRLPRVRWVHEQTHRRDRMRRLPHFILGLSARLFAAKVYRANYTPLLAAYEAGLE